MKQYLNLMQDILDNGTWQDNRTGIRTKMLPGAMLKFDLREGFPAVTTKKLYYGAVKGELLGFLRGCNTVKEFNELGCKVWDANAAAPSWLSNPNREGEGDLQRIYGVQWRQWIPSDWRNTVVEVPIKTSGIDLPFVPPCNNILVVKKTDDLTGQRLLNNEGNAFTVIEKIKANNNKNSAYVVQFETTTSIVIVLRPNLRRGQVSDPYKKTVLGQGCIGITKNKPPYYKNAYTMWHNMMKRCYDTGLEKYYLYGGKGIFVDQQWRCFSNFLKDLPKIPLFDQWKRSPNNYDLDKDYFCSNSYGISTTIFLPKPYNVTLPYVNGSKYIATNIVSNKKYEFTVHTAGAKMLNIRHPQFISHALLHSPTSSAKGWHFEEIKPKDGYVYRQRMVLDQIDNLLQQIRTNPTSRRLLVTAWRPDELDQMALPPCHYGFQVIIEQGSNTMHLLWTQRSVDVLLGLPFNIASYATLLHILAQLTGYKVGTLTGFLADVHLYENHLEQVKEQLSRAPFALPQLWIDTTMVHEDTPIEFIKPEHISLHNYVCHDAIKAPMAV